MPKLGAHETIPPVTPAQGEKRKRVGLLLGCVQREFMPEINAATVRVLAAEGCEVIAPPDQPCCGALMVHAGEETPALDLARRVIDVFEQREGRRHHHQCGRLRIERPRVRLPVARRSSVRRARGALLSQVQRYRRVSGGTWPRAERKPLNMRVAYHDSCHLQHAQRVRTQPRAQLSAIPGVEMLDLPEAALCCGSAGIYNLVQPKTADALADRKAQHITTAKPDVVATGNIGCMLQIAAALERQGQKTPVLHTIQLIDASINRGS